MLSEVTTAALCICNVKEIAEILRISSIGDAEDVMADAGVVRNGGFDNARMGRLPRKLEGKIIGGLRLAHEGTAQNATCWRISNTQTKPALGSLGL